MPPTAASARRAGALYLVFSLVAIFREFFFPAFIVPGDATATARNIAAAAFTYRIGLLTGFVDLILFVFLVVSLYQLLKDVDRRQAMLMVLLVCFGIAVALANLMNEFAPLTLLSSPGDLSAFTRPQLDALALTFLRLHGNGAIVATAFWGLWLFPFGVLVVKSGFLPRVLGILLMVAGVAYLATSAASIAAPAYRQVVSRFMMPLYFGEVPIIFWLLIAGVRTPQDAAGGARATP